MGIIRLSDLEPWIGVQKPAEESGASPLDAAWAKATAVANVVDTAATAFGGLDKAANDLTDGEAHPSEWTRRFDDAVGKLPVDGLADEDFADFQALTRMRSNRLKVAAVRRQHEDAVERFQDALDGYVQQAADAPSNAIEATFRNQALRAIERIDGAGLLGPGVADRLRAELPSRIDRALAQRVIARDPAHAAALLTQPGALPALDESERARLARKAGIRAERQGHEKALADESHRAGTVAELWSRVDTLDDTDIDAAEADGRLLAGEAQDFRQRLQVDRDARQWRTDAIARVNGILAGEGALDPSSPEDRKAVDAHFAATERGWDDNQVAAEQRPGQIGAYVGRTGILPAALKKRITSALRGGDTNRQNEAADVVAAIARSAGRGGLVELPVEDLLLPILILSLRDSGLDPAAAAARATAIIGGDAEARDRNVRRDLAAAGRWAEETGGFGDDQLAELRKGMDGLQASGTGANSAGERAATGPVAANGNQPPVDPNVALTELQQILTENFGIKDPSAIDPNVPRIQVAMAPVLPVPAGATAGYAGAAGAAGTAGAHGANGSTTASAVAEAIRRNLLILSAPALLYRSLIENDSSAIWPAPMTVPAPPIEDKYVNIPPVAMPPAIPGGSAGPRVQGPPAADSPDRKAKPIVNPGFGADFADILEHYLLREDKRGTPETVKGNKIVAQECRKVLKERYPKYANKVDHVGGSFKDGKDPTPKKDTYQKEATIKDEELGVHRRADGTWRFGNKLAHINTVTTLKDGVTPTALERRARDDIAKVADNIIRTVGKLKKGADENEYRKRARQVCEDTFEDLLGKPEEGDVPDAEGEPPESGKGG